MPVQDSTNRDSDEVEVLPPVVAEGISNIHVAEKVAAMLRAGRRYFGSSGASLTHQADNPEWASKGITPALARVGLEGERDTTRMLKAWMADKPNAVLVDSVHIRGWGKEEVLDEETGIIDGGDTDHLLIIGREVIIIDTKRWKSKRTYTVNEKGMALRTNKIFPGSELKIVRASHMWLKYLWCRPAPPGTSRKDNPYATLATPIVHINTDEIRVIRDGNWYKNAFRLVEKDRFIDFLDRKYDTIDARDKKVIESTLVAQVVLCCVKPYDARKAVIDSRHLNAFM